MASLTVDHALFASALQVSPYPGSSVPVHSKPTDQNPKTSDSPIIDNEKSVFSADSHQTSEFRVTGVRFIVLFAG